MPAETAQSSSSPRPEDVDALRDLVIEGRALDAFAYASRFGPFEGWVDLRARWAAEWLCSELGAPKRGRALALRSIRRAPRSTMGRILRIHAVLTARGPLEGHRAIHAMGPLGEDATPEDRAEVSLLQASALAGVRDFDRAEATLQEAERLGAAPRRIALLRARILMGRDRYAEALDSALRALAIVPDHPAAIALAGHLHALLGDADAGLTLLRAGASRTQSSDLALLLAATLHERGLHDERHAWIERWAERVPLLEDTDRLTCLRADSAYDRGDLPEARRLLQDARSPFHARIASRLAEAKSDAGAQRVLLDVPFVRQHDMTCAPATLTALARYWSMPAQHLEVADAICYDGTPHHSQRTWAEENGFVARELTVTWDVARALLDRGIPFTVAIVQGANAHLQAIVGYDARRGTIFLRDPFEPQRIEALAAEWLETWRATGPQGMAIVPRAERARLDGIDLPEALLYDDLHRTNAALERHDREAASAAATALATAAPRHRLAVQARRALAAYDQDPERVLACALETAAAFPEFVTARLDALGCMRAIRPREERIATAEALVASHPDEPLYAEALARELVDDAREHGRAARLLRGAIRRRPDRHTSLALLAEMRWAHRDFDEALALYRFAACLGRFDERAVKSYFAAARALGREGEALVLVEARAAELGPRGSAPVTTLFDALDALGHTEDGLRALDTALATRREDGELLLFAARARASLGEPEVARALLARAEPFCSRTDWLRSASELALRSGAFVERKDLLEQLITREPLDVRAHAAYASALAASDGSLAARRHLEGASRRAPHLRALAHLHLEWLRGAGAVGSEGAARRALETDPTDAWTQRELAMALVAQGRLDEARAAVDAAAELVPSDVSLERVRAVLLRREGRYAEERAAQWAALRLDPDLADVIAAVVASASDGAERDRTLASLEALVQARSVSGVGIIAWYLAARSVQDGASLRASVDRARAERASHWATWSCAVRHRSFAGEHDAALALADEACARFPLVAALWTDRADALAAAGRSEDAVRALERAVQVDALDEAALGRLAGAYVRSGAHAGARALLERAIGRAPTSTGLRAQLAGLLWGLGDRDAALGHVESALAMDADDERAWNLLDEWSTAEGRTEEGLRRIESFSAERPWNGHAMLVLARAKARREDTEGALAALDRAIAADPVLFDAHDYRATLLALLARFDEAEAACAPAAYAHAVPRELRGRAAWVHARRGDLRRATDLIRALLAHHPDYTWGWSQLAEWSRKRGAPGEFLEAARQVVFTAPRVAVAHQQLASALFASGDRTAAKAALARAVDLAPNDESLVSALFEASLEDGDDAAAGALVPLLHGARAAAGLAAEARLRARHGDSTAIDSLRALATHPHADAATLEAAFRGCVLAGLGEACDALFRTLIEVPSAHATAGEIWARSRVLRDDAAGAAKAMRALDPALPAVRAAASAWLLALSQRSAKDALRDAARIVAARFTHCDDALWATVASGLLTGGALDECVAWTRDWRARPGATPSMLLMVASAMRETGRDEEAVAVVRFAAPLEPGDGASRSHRAWLALHLALHGEAAEARRWLTKAGELRGVPVLEGVAALVEALLVLPESGGGARALLRARSKLAAARASCKFEVVLRAHERAERRIARDGGFPLGWALAHRRAILSAAAVLGGLALIVCFMAWSSSGSPSGPSSPLPIGVLLFFGIRAFLAKEKKR